MTAHDLDNELAEPSESELDSGDLAVNVILEPFEPSRDWRASKNPFLSAEYWCSKGYKMQTGRSSNENLNQHLKSKNKFGFKAKVEVQDQSEQALDYYLQGLRIDDRHFGCSFNIGCIFLKRGMNRNAQKWFKIAIRFKAKS